METQDEEFLKGFLVPEESFLLLYVVPKPVWGQDSQSEKAEENSVSLSSSVVNPLWQPQKEVTQGVGVELVCLWWGEVRLSELIGVLWMPTYNSYWWNVEVKGGGVEVSCGFWMKTFFIIQMTHVNEITRHDLMCKEKK